MRRERGCTGQKESLGVSSGQTAGVSEAENEGGIDEDDVPRAPDMAPEIAACLGSTKCVAFAVVAEGVAGAGAGGSSPTPMKAWGVRGRRRLPTGGAALSGRRRIGERGDCEGSGEEPERMTCSCRITSWLLEEEEMLLDDENNEMKPGIRPRHRNEVVLAY